MFLVTFAAARVTVFLIMDHGLPDLFLHVGGTHVHHLNYGIFLLSGVGGYVLVCTAIGGGFISSARCCTRWAWS